jgi:hypothetical protein
VEKTTQRGASWYVLLMKYCLGDKNKNN